MDRCLEVCLRTRALKLRSVNGRFFHFDCHVFSPFPVWPVPAWKPGERPLDFGLGPDPALLVELPCARQLHLVGGIGAGYSSPMSDGVKPCNGCRT